MYLYEQDFLNFTTLGLLVELSIKVAFILFRIIKISSSKNTKKQSYAISWTIFPLKQTILAQWSSDMSTYNLLMRFFTKYEMEMHHSQCGVQMITENTSYGEYLLISINCLSKVSKPPPVFISSMDIIGLRPLPNTWIISVRMPVKKITGFKAWFIRLNMWEHFRSIENS